MCFVFPLRSEVLPQTPVVSRHRWSSLHHLQLSSSFDFGEILIWNDLTLDDPIWSNSEWCWLCWCSCCFWWESANGLVKQVSGGVSANEIIKLNPWVLEMQKRYWTSKTLCGLHLLHSLHLLGCKPTNFWILLVIKRDLSLAKIKSTIENEVPLLQLAFHNVFQCSSMGSFWKDMTTCPHRIGIYTESTKNQDSNQPVWLGFMLVIKTWWFTTVMGPWDI